MANDKTTTESNLNGLVMFPDKPAVWVWLGTRWVMIITYPSVKEAKPWCRRTDRGFRSVNMSDIKSKTTGEPSLDSVILQIEYLVTRKLASRDLLDAAYRERAVRLGNDECHTTQDVMQ
jgi:hypothetical protein